MKFLADSMLGRLAKWLRILGYDTLYFSSLEDNNLVRIARAEGRIILTRDREMVRRRGIDSLLIESDDFRAQICQALRHFDLNLDSSFSRCSVCNSPLQRVAKGAVRERVPPYVFQTQERFSLCPRCGKIYWQGTHWQRIRERLKGLEEEML